MTWGEDVAAAVSDLLVARELEDDLVDAKLVRALAQEGQNLVAAAAERGDALVYVAKKLPGECPAI
jgi:hypothetical protein